MNGVEFMTNRANPGIDPFSIWGWEIPVYLFLGGLVAGLMIVGSIQESKFHEQWEERLSRIVPALAIIFLSLGMFALFLDLEIKGLKLNIIRLYLTFKPASPISWGAWILVFTYPALILWFLASVSRADINRVSSMNRLLKPLDILHDWAVASKSKILTANTVLGIALGIYTGIFLSSMASRPVWHSGVLGPLFLISGISSGAAFMAFFKVNHDLSKSFIRWDIFALITELVLLGLFLLDNITGAAFHQAAAMLFLTGPYAGAFFGIVILLGILAPLTLEWAELTGRAKAPVLASVLVLIGGLALRFIIVCSGQACHCLFSGNMFIH